MGGEKPREIAARTLLARAKTGAFTESLLDEALGKNRLEAKDRALLRQLVYGVVRWERTLDWLVGRKTQNRPQNAALQTLLRMGLFQIFWLERIPNHAAVHETVALAKKMGFANQSGFVNAVLRGYLREEEATRQALAALKSTEAALGYSHPDWLVARWVERWGASTTRDLLDWNNTPAEAFARVNRLKLSSEELQKVWESEGVQAEAVAHPWISQAPMFQLQKYSALDTLGSFQQGLFYVQDPSTVLAVAQLNPRPGERVLDLCAAPGGKTTLIAQMMEDKGEVWAHDLERDRLELVRENAMRLGVKSIRYVKEAAEFLTESFDRVLVDAPCSNTGVMRRRVDLRWRIKPEEVTRLRSTQLDLLKLAARRVKPGGTLVYSTCSLEEEENGAVVREFLDNHREFVLEQETQLHPAIHQTDGAYVAALRNDAAR